MAALPEGPIQRFSVESYHAMINAGILRSGDRVELLDGYIAEKMSKNPPHRIAALAALRIFMQLVPQGWYVDKEAPITLLDSEPEPDVAIIRGDTRDYPSGHPGSPDVALVVEVADASLLRDRGVKKRVYANAPIPTYWLLNLVDRRLEVYSAPKAGEYCRCDIYRPEDSAPIILDGVEAGSIPVASLLP